MTTMMSRQGEERGIEVEREKEKEGEQGRKVPEEAGRFRLPRKSAGQRASLQEAAAAEEEEEEEGERNTETIQNEKKQS